MAQLTKQQDEVLSSTQKNMIVSASAGSGKTFVMISYITKLLVDKRVPLRKMLVLTFTRAAAGEMRERLNKALLAQKKMDSFILEQIDDLSIADISTIDAFCEKLIRRNLDKLPLDESFRLIENAEELKSKAFDNALAAFAVQNVEKLNEIYSSFRKNKNQIFQTVMDLDDFFTYQPAGKIDYFINNQAELHEKALELLNEKLKDEITALISELNANAEKFVSEPKYQMLCQTLTNHLSLELNNDFATNVQNLKLINLPNVPVVRGENRDERLSDIAKNLRQKCKTFLDGLNKYNFTDPVLVQKQKSGSLAAWLLSLYKIFAEEYSVLKKKLDVLDFVDIERFALELMKDENILSDLQEKYDYIFVDEYQDTNRVQEAIIKPITEKGHFVAVGDPKQGIYGFRNATMEIMKEQIAQFSASDDGTAKYLTGNFRSDARLLEFVNRVFETVMTTQSVGIDYKSTSMLTGQVQFEKMELPSVRVDIVSVEKEQSQTVSKEVYSVKDDVLQTTERDETEVDTILARIDELLMHKIYDEKIGAFRQVQFEDIAILLRSRSSLMEALSLKLTQKGYPCHADVKQNSMQEAEVQMLVNLLKLLIDKENDLALISVMNSKIGGFSLDELAALRLAMPEEKHFYDIYKTNLNLPKLAEFDNMLTSLKLRAQVKGLTSALNELFVDKDYFAYLKFQDASKYIKINNFLQDIKSQQLDYDIAGAISYFSEIGGASRNAIPSGAGIKIMTIHASKGLEYPIVILAGAGQKLEKPSMKSYVLNSNFGLALPAYNEQNNTRCTTPVLEMAKIENRRKEMIDEIMIFYVALTRAKNHLYIVGQENVNNLIASENYDVTKAKNYLSLVGYAFGKQFIENLIEKQSLSSDDWEFNIVTEVKELKFKAQETSMLSINEELKKSLERYMDFAYEGREHCNINLKNTVTALNAHEHMSHIVKTENAESIEIGNAYHEALKILDFDKIVNLSDLNRQIEDKKALFNENYLNLINRELLLKNILMIKEIVGEDKLFKEKQFVMSAPACDVMDSSCADEILVQGVVDLFALGKQNVLIDFKYTGETSPDRVIDRYKAQLNLYGQAIEKGFKIKLDKKYILSLKNAQIIEYLG